MRRQQVPSSPSWRSIRMRSNSLPRTRVARRNSLNNGEEPEKHLNDSVGTGVRSWAKSWLSGHNLPDSSRNSTFMGSVNADVDDENHRNVSSPVAKRQMRRAPVLTLALLRLEEQLPTFCQYLSDPHVDNVYSACSLIDSTVATASPGNQHGSPSLFVGSPPSQRSSPSRSPIRSWLAGSSGSPTSMSSVSSTAMALEGEWERFVLPLFLLAGAESIYASLGHSSDPVVAHNLTTLYQRITKDLNLVREVLCDPLLASEGDSFAPTLALYYEKASSLSTSLHALSAFTQTRSQLIQFHSQLWESAKPDFSAHALLFHELLPNLPREGSSAKSMVKGLEDEVLCWKYLMKTAAALEQCRFAETVISAQKTKTRLRLTSKTCIQTWMRLALKHLISVFPIVFDRIQAFSKPLYGFRAIPPVRLPRDLAHLGPSEDLETEVLDFLRRQEKAGGPSMAISVVMKSSPGVKQTGQNIERGFFWVQERGKEIHENEVSEHISAEPGSVRSSWPAIFMRTTNYHGLQTQSTAHGGILDNMRQSSSRIDKTTMLKSRSHMDKSLPNESSSGKLRSWSNDSARCASYETYKESNVMEYASQSCGNSVSWPYSSWKSLIAVLAGTGEEPDSPAEESGRASIFDSFDRASLRNLELDFKSLALPTWAGARTKSSLGDALHRVSQNPRRSFRGSDQTSFHISALNDYMWLVVMIKPGEESRWHRRRSGKIVEDEASEFVTKFAPRLRSSEYFKASHVRELRSKIIKSNCMGSVLIDEVREEKVWNEDDIQKFLQVLKDDFQLRAPRSSHTVPLRSSYRLGFRSVGAKSPKFGSASRSVPLPDLQTSAAALFLGPDLLHAIGFDS